MMSSRERLKKLIDERVHHKNDWDKIPAITRDLDFHYLDWLYDDKKICVKSNDYDLIALIKEAIHIYLEEKEEDLAQREEDDVDGRHNNLIEW